MPVLTVCALRLALSQLAVGFTLGGLMLASRAALFSPALLRLRPLHVELLLIGWTVQLAFGVAYWILPRRGSSGRGGELLPWSALTLLNLGVLTTGGGGLLGAGGLALATGRAAELLAAALFAIHAWPRVRLYTSRSPYSGSEPGRAGTEQQSRP